MPYFTIKEVLDAAQDELRDTTLENYCLTRFDSQQGIGDLERFDIFLSHSYRDKDIVIGLHTILEAAGFRVYLDWKHDAHLARDQVDANTADRLRTRMSQSSSLLYATTTGHTVSKWMPWEAGYFDGLKGRVAILPVVDDGASFDGQEYLSLYPLVERSLHGRGPETLKIMSASDTSNWRFFSEWIDEHNTDNEGQAPLKSNL